MKLKVWFMNYLLVFALILTACNGTDGGEEEASTSNYPENDINIVIPYASGGSADLQARVIGEFIQNELSTTVNVNSRGGGAGSTGMNFISTSDPDGHTIILTAVGPSTLTPNENDVGYNVVDDFAQIAQISEAPYGLAVNTDSEIETLEELFEKGGTENEVHFATTGAGLHQHVVMSALLSELDDVHMEHIPFEGGAEAVSALLGNHVTASKNTVSEIIPHHEDNALKILAVTSEDRIDQLPDVPTFSELGYDLIGNGAWFGFMAPKDTPQEVIEILDETIKKSLEDEDVQEQFGNAGLPISYLNHEEFTEKVVEEDEKNAGIIKSLED